MKIRILLGVLAMAAVVHATTNEITVTSSLKVNKDNVQIERKSGTTLIQMTGKRYNVQTITATTTNQALTKGSVDQAGYAFCRNLGTNGDPEVHLTFDNGVTTSMVFKAGEPALFRVAPGATVSEFTAAASSGSVDFEFTVIED